MTESGMDDTRRREDAAIRMEEQFRLFRELYHENEQRAQSWRTGHDEKHASLKEEMETRFKPLEEMRDTLNTPAKIIRGILVLMMTPVAGYLGWYIVKWVLMELEKMIAHSPIG